MLVFVILGGRMVDGLLSSLNLLELHRHNHRKILKRKLCGEPHSSEETRLGPRVPALASWRALPFYCRWQDTAPGPQPRPLSYFRSDFLNATSDYFPHSGELMELLINMTRGRESKSRRVCAKLSQEFAEIMFVNVC